MPIDPDATIIPDQAEVWLKLKSDVSSISSMIPSAISTDLEGLGWEFSGLIDDVKGIPIEPTVEVKPYNAFGYPQFRVKLRNGTLKTGFTALESNAVTNKVILPGSASNKVGIPSDVQVYVLYKFVDDATTRIWVSLKAAPIELTAHGGIVDGELSFADMMIHHTADANGDVFQEITGSGGTTKTITLGAGVTAYTVTVGGQTTSSISTLTSAALQTALRLLSTVGSTGVTVTGSGTGPFTAAFTASSATVTATGTGGTVTVA